MGLRVKVDDFGSVNPSTGVRMDLPPGVLVEVDVDHDVSPYEDPANLRPVWSRVLVMSMCDYWLAPPTSVRFKEALEWLFHSDPTSANSFENVCLLLRLPPTQVRAMVAARCSEYRQDPSRAASFVRDMQSNGLRLPR